MFIDKNKGPRLGVVVGVDSDISTIGLYNLTNDPQMIWDGNILPGPKVGSYVTIFQYNVRIIASVFSERVSDQQNSINNREFDNRYSPGSINRVIQLKTKGVIFGAKFSVTSKYVPMVGNEVHATTQDELNLIYGVTTSDGGTSLNIGESLLEGLPVKIDVNKVFASHVGIFGNTGSGKSNTLHYLYYKLFEKYNVLDCSKVLIIDFNGEYIAAASFGISIKQVIKIDSYSGSGDKVIIPKGFFFDPTTLIRLFSARSGVQAPFLVKAVQIFNKVEEFRKKYKEENLGTNSDEFNGIVSYLFGATRKVLRGGENKIDLISSWFESVKAYVKVLKFDINHLGWHGQSKCFYYNSGKTLHYASSDLFFSISGLDSIAESLASEYVNINSPIDRFFMVTEFQKSYYRYFQSGNLEFLNPLFSRMDSVTKDLSSSIVLRDKEKIEKGITIVSLKNASLEMKRLIPMLMAKMYYQNQKDSADSSTHLIIDEAHNILSSADSGSGDVLQDYRLHVFEEIIKEGRKFGFFLTLASQRPFDISTTIISQLHNNFIHRLVNEKDLQAILNSVPTMDRGSFAKIPSLGQGEVLVAGNGIPVPVFVKVPHSDIRPESDDLVLAGGESPLWELTNGEKQLVKVTEQGESAPAEAEHEFPF